MAGETQRMHAVKELDAGSKLQDEGTALEQTSEKNPKESSEHFSSTGTEARASSRGPKAEKIEKKRDCPQQREAVIRPQQAGKIDFRLLQNRSKFATDRTWSSGKGSPQSPSGKSRSREKGKRSVKTERGNPQQLYRPGITSPRTVGIAYPQQKVLPPKELETSRGPVSGSYRFHVPSIPEREAELQQEELSYSRCFQEASSNLTSQSYTSQALGSSSGTSSHPHLPLSQQQPASMESNSGQPGGQLFMDDFHLSGSNAWASPERTFNGANFGVSSQKSTSFSEANKANPFVPGSFQYGYHLTEESTSDSFPCEQDPQSQDFTNSSLGSVHVTHNSFSFAPGEGHNFAQNNTQFSNEQQPEDRSTYPHTPQSQFMQGVPSSTQCPRNLSEDSASSDSSGSSSQQSEQGKTVLPESTDTIGQADSRDAAITSGSKRNCHPKDTAANQRTLIQGSVHARNTSQGPGSPMHFPNKTFNSIPVNNIRTGTVPFDKNINNNVLNRLPHSWEGPNKAYSPEDQNTIQYADMNDKFQFQNQPAIDQRPNSSKNSRMPWQQIRPTSAIPNQNRMELSRQISNQKLAYIVSPSDWQDDTKSHKSSSLKTPSAFQNNRSSDGFSNQRQEAVKKNSNTVTTFKVETSHSQVCESKNKIGYYGLNHPLPAAPSRNYSYPPLQVPPMGLMMVSPYESPLPSPVHNHASSSTCSSHSPASTSPVNISSEDSQMSKPAPSHPFYHQPQGKTQNASDHLSTHPHQFHSDPPRNLLYGPDRAKDDMMSYLQSSSHAKTTIDGSKVYMDSFGVEHQQPPPPYSAHQLLASSLATANLDQLDVLLTCKQCDQNFNNLASFLGHKQYCAHHTFAQNDLKDTPKIEDGRKYHSEPAKAVSSVSNASLSRCSSDLHLSLLGLNKNGDLISDSEMKGDNKDDSMKLFSSSGNLPELEMDAKLDSLITEALNGLGYQSDNAEIDSSFIDAFVDDDLTTVKTSLNKQSLKMKESLVFESKNKQAVDDVSFTQEKYFYGSDVESPEKISLNLEQDEKINIKKEISHTNSRNASREKTWEQGSKVKEAKKPCKSEDENTNPQRFLLSSKFSERCGVKSFQDSAAFRGSAHSQASTSPTSKTAVKESKRKNAGGGTWSKELIHKIVQQKNKLHKLHVKGTKNLQFSLVMERLTPTVQNPDFGEYDYVSDSDDECEPVKIASQGRLNQSSRCKYTYTKECKWRAKSERDQAAWRHESKECFEMKKSEEVSLSPDKHSSHQRLRRRGSRSSTSSELSTSVSVSSDSINSPKSTDRTDSDCEKKTDRNRESPEQKTHEWSSPQKLFKESSTLALTFTKSVKKYNNKSIHSDNKDSTEDPKRCNSNPEAADPVASSQKAKDTIKHLEKSRTSHTKSREKPVSHKKEPSTAVSSDRNSLQRADNLCPKEELTQCGSTDNKALLFNSQPPTTKETDFNIDRNTKGKRREGSQAAQPELSDTPTFEKQSDSVCVVKEAITLVNDLVTHKPASLCSSLMDDVCLSPTESHSPLIQKDTLHLMPYPLDQEQGLIKSPLSFDTSSMFGDLTGFDSGLYSEMPIQKEGFHSIENTAEKKEAFVSSFSPFLEQRDWNLIVSPVLPDEISQYKGNSEKSNEKKPDYNHIPLSLPEKITDYSANLNSCASDDELEIKRIVNELENQLQTTKMESPPILDQHIPKQLQMSKFSPLRLGDESESEGPTLDAKCSVQTIEVPVPMPAEPFAEQGLSWPGTFQFELMGDHHSPHTTIHSESDALEIFSDKDGHAQNLISTASHIEQPQPHHDQKTEERSTEKDTPVETKEEILEQKRYTENLMKSLEVISDSIFKKEPLKSVEKEPNVNSPKSQQHVETECQATDAVEREDHGEKEAIPKGGNILSPPNINERKDEIEFILNESESSLSSKADPKVIANQPISVQPSEPTENKDYKEENKVTSEGDISKSSTLTEAAHCSSVVTHDPHMGKESCENSNAEDNVIQLFKNSSDCQKYSSIDEDAEAEGVLGHSDVHLLSPDPSPDIAEKMANVTKAALEQQSADSHKNHEDKSSSHADEIKVECSGNESLEISVETSKQDHLIGLSVPTETYSETDLSMEIVTTDKPCSPLLVETNTEGSTCCSPFHDTQSIEGQSNLLIISQSDGIINGDSCKMTPFNDSLKTETGLVFESTQKQDEILNVQDIKEQLPIDFMASQHNSPCRDDAEESHCVFLGTVPPVIPLLSTSHQQPVQECDTEKDSYKSNNKSNGKCIDQGSIQNTKSPANKDKNQNVKDDSNSDELDTTVEMEYSLISPPHLHLGIIECKIPRPETTISSPLPVTTMAEPAEVSDSLEKTDLIYDFKLSPLNYNSISDEPPQLNQYDYIPVSPANQPKENVDTKQGPSDDCESCDLNINPALGFNKTETDTAASLNSDPAAKLYSSDEPIVLQQSMKFTCFSLGLPAQSKRTDSSAANVKTNLEVYHEPLKPVEDFHIHADLLSKAETETLESHNASVEDCTLLKKNFSDGPPTPKPLIICQSEQMLIPSDPSEKQPTIDTGQCSTTHQIHKDATQKKTPNNAQQGKVLCEICFMCFRTVPGLKRHKAMKHLVRAEKHIGPQSATSSYQGSALIYEASQTTEKKHKDDSQTCYTAKIDGLTEISSTLISKAAETESVLEEMASETTAVAVNEIGYQTPMLSPKAKKNNKARKHKNSEVNRKPNHLSDELLNILKTDILQAITPEFKSSALQERSRSPEEQEKTSERTEEFPHYATSESAFDNISQSPTKEANVHNETGEIDQVAHAEEPKCTSNTKMANLEVCTDNNVENIIAADKEIIREREETRKTPCPAEDMCELKGSDDSLAQEILRNVAGEIKCEKNSSPSDKVHPLSCLNSTALSPPSISPDLKALFDDDTTFSQLFPRDEEAKRKKCPRVYSKRNKRQKLSPHSNVTADFLPPESFMQCKDQYAENQAEQTFNDNQPKHCEYETISLDDAIMLNMCHNSTIKTDVTPLADVKQKDQEDVRENIKELCSNLLKPLESTVDKSSIQWRGSTDFAGFDAGSTVTSDPNTCKPEVASTPAALPAAPYTAEPEAIQTFHSIDIQNMNTTFQLPEIQFFDSNKDISVAPPTTASVDVEKRDDDKSSKVAERRGRKRQDGGIKVKDKQYKCKVCFTWFLTLGELNFHKLSHNPSPPPTCYMCVQRKFSSREQLRDHLREKHAKNKTGIWTCGMCLKEISDVWMYNEHLREHATQFARRGQTQGSMLGISGSFMQETAVKNFISSIMQHRPSKVSREASKVNKEQEKAVSADNTMGEGAEPKLHKSKSSSGAGGKNILTPLEVLHKTETSKSVEMHPNCKDPSRDCHHCGKQFPKPFKLQRHLVVHNLERIFLCHKCPVSYQDSQELKDHLKRAHEEVDELDSKHTTLYTCELCADVMHVIKKSFICSTCNYTFSKKEQFDRHMEKHLSGGNKIFKFRGVLRPVRISVSKEDECVSPASKKKRILSDSLQENSSDSGIASVSSLHLNQNSDTQSSKAPVSMADDSTQTITNEYQSNTNNTSVKTEDIADDYSELLVELEKCIHLDPSESATPKKEETDPTLSPHLDKEVNEISIAEACDVKEENELVHIRAETPCWSVSKESSGPGGEIVKANEGSAQVDTTEAEEKTDSPPPSENSAVSLIENQISLKTPESPKSESAADMMDQQGVEQQWHQMSNSASNDSKQQMLSHGVEQENDNQTKDTLEKSIDNTKSSPKNTESTPVLLSKVFPNASVSNEEKESLRRQKKRKDTKSPHNLQRVSSPVTQENFGVESRAKKKFCPSKCGNPSLQRKSDGLNEYPVLSSVRDDVVSNKIISKCKTVSLGLQSKRNLLDSCTQKKAEFVSPQNGDYKTKKGPLGRSLHPPISKVSSVPMNNSLNKSRPKIGVRSMETHSYRTAESQNHLLSQLFGQKLTSFKIPLRKDTSESIN